MHSFCPLFVLLINTEASFGQIQQIHHVLVPRLPDLAIFVPMTTRELSLPLVHAHGVTSETMHCRFVDIECFSYIILCNFGVQLPHRNVWGQ